MRPPQELMERLAAADPLPNGERLAPEEQHDADELLARLLATPPESPVKRRAGRRLRRMTLVAAATVCAGLAGFTVVNLLDSDAPGPDVVERAVAAVSNSDVVYHVVERKLARSSGPAVPGENLRIYFESWHTTDGRFHQTAFAHADRGRGRLLGDLAGRRTPGRRGGPVLRWDASTNTIYSNRFGSLSGSRGAPSLDQFADPGTQLRSLEAQGRMHLTGSVDFAGRRAYRLASRTVTGLAPGSEERIVFLVDAETYLPLANRYTSVVNDGDTLDLFTRYLVYERLPVDARGVAKLDLDPHPGARCALGAGETMGRGTLGFPNPCSR